MATAASSGGVEKNGYKLVWAAAHAECMAIATKVSSYTRLRAALREAVMEERYECDKDEHPCSTALDKCQRNGAYTTFPSSLAIFLAWLSVLVINVASETWL